MTGTKAVSATSTYMKMVAYGAQEDPTSQIGFGFSDVYDRATSNTSKDDFGFPVASANGQAPASGKTNTEDMGTGVKTPVKVDRSHRGLKAQNSNIPSEDTRMGKRVSGRDLKADGSAEDSYAAKEVLAAVNENANQNVNEAIAQIDEETMETIATTINQVADEIMDLLGLTPEELSAIMESMGMKQTDLLNPDFMTQLVVEASAEGDILSLTTDETLLEMAQSLTETVDGAAKQLMEQLLGDIGAEDEGAFKDILGAFETQTEALTPIEDAVVTELESGIVAQETKEGIKTEEFLVSAKETGTVTETINVQNMADRLPAGEDELVKAELINNDPAHVMEDIPQDVSLTDSRTQYSEDVAVKVDEAIVETTVVSEKAQPITVQDEGKTTEELTAAAQEEKSPVDEALVTDVSKSSSEDDTSESSEEDHKGMSSEASKEASTVSSNKKDDTSAGEVRSQGMAPDIRSFIDALKPDGNIQAPIPEQGLSDRTVEAYDILRQINENIRAQAGSQLTEIDMHLNPETLGNLHIHLSSKEGVITAQFVAESEAVKNALTAQAVELRETLQEQGLKVEAVEVTIAGQELNRSYSENGEGQGRFEEPQKKNRSHNIQLSGDATLDDVDGLLLDEGERLTAEMMALNGNTMDMMA